MRDTHRNAESLHDRRFAEVIALMYRAVRERGAGRLNLNDGPMIVASSTERKTFRLTKVAR